MTARRSTSRAGEALGDGRPLAADDRELRRAARARERLYRQAYDAGHAGASWDPEVWPEGADVRDAYDAGVIDRRRDRRAARWTLAGRLARWVGRTAAPGTARRLRRAGRRWRRTRRTLRGVR